MASQRDDDQAAGQGPAFVGAYPASPPLDRASQAAGSDENWSADAPRERLSRTARIRELVRQYGRWFHALLGTVIGVAFLWVVMQWADAGEAMRLLRDVDVVWLAIGLLAYACALMIRSVRWHLLMIEEQRPSLRGTATALVVGYAVNNVLPARLGELFRADFCGRAFNLSRTMAMGSIILERLLDGVVVIACLAAGLALLHPPQDANAVEAWRALSLGAPLVLLPVVIVVLIGTGRLRLPGRSFHWIHERTRRLESSLKVMQTRTFWKGAALSIPVWIFDGTAIWAVVRGVGFTLDVPAMLFLLGVASLSTLVPSAPAYMGTYHAAYAMLFAIVGFGSTAGVAAAVAVQLSLLLPVTIVGLGTLVVMSWRS